VPSTSPESVGLRSQGGTPAVAVLAAGSGCWPIAESATKVLREFGVPVTEHTLNAHRAPDETIDFASTAREQGYGVVICAAGGAAHLAGLVAAYTTLPVIGVPVSMPTTGGLDALYSTVQMPHGAPVATVAIDGGLNAGLLAAEILAVHDVGLTKCLAEWRAEHRRRQKPRHGSPTGVSSAKQTEGGTPGGDGPRHGA
jgi:5-(carboxyamino)imidazole ribonucleotide mutase